MSRQSILKKTPPNSLLTYGLLAFVAMAGLSYINFMPGVVNALAGSIGFSDAEAGQVIAMNGYGGIVGSTIAIFLVRRVRWQRAMFAFMAILTVVDTGTIWINEYASILAWRFAAGVLGGLCVGIAFSVLARLENPDRAFGLLLFIQFSIGSIVISLLPILENLFGAYAVFYIMALFVLLSLTFLPFLPRLSKEKTTASVSNDQPKSFTHGLLVLLAILLYQIAASAIWAYVGLIGLSAKISNEDVSLYIAMTGLLGLAGALLPVINRNRVGRLFQVVVGVMLSCSAALLIETALHFYQSRVIYITAMSLLFFSWPAVQSYLLAVTAELDTSGRLSTIAAVVSSLGMASGPLLASLLLDGNNFSVMLYTCAGIFLMSAVLLFNPVQTQEKPATTVLQ